MTLAGWLFMSSSLALVWTLAGWCCYKVLTAPAPAVKDPVTDTAADSPVANRE